MVAPNLGGSVGYAAKSDVPWNFATIPEAISCLHWSSSISNISQDSRLQDVKSANILCCSILLLYICWLLPFGESHQSFQDFLTSSTKSSSSSTAKETSESQKWTLDESKIATLWQFLVKLSNVKLPKNCCLNGAHQDFFNYRRWGPWGPRIFIVLLEGVPRNAAFGMILRDDSTWNPGFHPGWIWYTVDSCLIHINDVCIMCIYIYYIISVPCWILVHMIVLLVLS